jgi:hypothetical protein
LTTEQNGCGGCGVIGHGGGCAGWRAGFFGLRPSGAVPFPGIAEHAAVGSAKSAKQDQSGARGIECHSVLESGRRPNVLDLSPVGAVECPRVTEFTARARAGDEPLSAEQHAALTNRVEVEGVKRALGRAEPSDWVHRRPFHCQVSSKLVLLSKLGCPPNSVVRSRIESYVIA